MGYAREGLTAPTCPCLTATDMSGGNSQKRLRPQRRTIAPAYRILFNAPEGDSHRSMDSRPCIRDRVGRRQDRWQGAIA
ncbi:hypothetical protein CHELA20_51216 [Hyphomicrobiales bacterium]|nr:hypothetical protein CHELA41_23796 [Hyphomicrobiales bacterium]CAH1674501.1 hypothetical protein CHELA20_51216 [Hyphomicrobiales bacterium]